MKNEAHFIVTDKVKVLQSPNYNYIFQKTDGFFARWGEKKEDDPSWAPFGPEIMDIEISEGEGCPLSCPFCSPAGTMINTPNGKVAIEDIKHNDLVIGYDVDKKTPRVQSVEEVYVREFTGEMFCIETANGNVLNLTPDHEVYTQSRGWVLAKNLTENDDILHF